ncbi:MAG: DUF1016 family protein [Gammaproteobacteria bacterium]|nr:DUF1016 family protein [Gammaproteobacteria bacterium]
MNKNQLTTHNNNLINTISQLIEQARNQVKRNVNNTMVQLYWEIGRLIVEDEQQGEQRAEYGKATLKHLSAELTKQFGKGFDVRNLRNMRNFYITFPKRNTLCTELSWSHYRTLVRIKNPQARTWYMNESVTQNWSVRALERQIGVLYYERLLSSQSHKLVSQEAEQHTNVLATNTKDYLRDPYILDFFNLEQPLLESDLENDIINNIQEFLLELGKGFAFVERQQRISTTDEDFYIDLVFYNFKLKCFLLIDLKIGKLTHQDVGQMDTYVRIYDQHKKGDDDNPTIGLVLCSEKSEAVAKYSVLADSQQLFSAKYLPYLPTELELQEELQQKRQLIEGLGYE